MKNYYIYGKHPATAALSNSKRKILEIYCTQEIFTLHKNLIGGRKYKIVTNQQIGAMLPKDCTHQGIALLVAPIALNSLSDVDLTDDNTKVAILDQVTDPHNLGAVLRSAAAFGIKAIIMANDNSAEENGIVAKTASAALELVPIIRVVNLKAAIQTLQKQGFWIIGLDGSGKEFISKKLLSGKVAIVLGAEGSGMRRLTTESCDILARIPIMEEMESLNVSTAAAIAFWEARTMNE
jgi:23S rRNA (guanosine2251-2'-O)-methyltransferase